MKFINPSGSLQETEVSNSSHNGVITGKSTSGPRGGSVLLWRTVGSVRQIGNTNLLAVGKTTLALGLSC